MILRPKIAVKPGLNSRSSCSVHSDARRRTDIEMQSQVRKGIAKTTQLENGKRNQMRAPSSLGRRNWRVLYLCQAQKLHTFLLIHHKPLITRVSRNTWKQEGIGTSHPHLTFTSSLPKAMQGSSQAGCSCSHDHSEAKLLLWYHSTSERGYLESGSSLELVEGSSGAG